MIQSYNNRYGFNLILTVFFILGIGASLYFIYSLPSGLKLAAGYQPVFLPVYIASGLTFMLGIASLFLAMNYKKEIIVFRDKIIDSAQLKKEADEQAGRTTISLDAIKNALAISNQKEAISQWLQSICKQLNAGQGAFYETSQQENKRVVELKSGYALSIGESTSISFEFGEGLVGQVAATGQKLYVDDVPEGYITILSGLGSSSPRYLLIVPVKKQDQVSGVLEIASFTKTTEDQVKFVEEAAQLISEKISKQA